jgi:hypothetical protein
LTANWATEWNINSLSAIDLPFPNKFAKFIEKQLYPNFPAAINQFVIHDGVTGITAQQQEVADHFKAYEDASVKYLVAPTAVVLLPALAKLGVTQVYTDSIVTIYELPHPRSFYSTTSSSCSVKSTNDNAASVNCPTGSSTLIRTELAMAGWHAYVNGKEVTIKTSDGAYQSIPVPKGTSDVTFSYLPPHEKYAILAGLIGALFFAFSWLSERLPRSRPRHKK